VTAAVSRRTAELLDEPLAELTAAASGLDLAFVRASGGASLRELSAHPPLSELPIAAAAAWARNEGAQTLIMATGTTEPVPTSLYVALFVVPVDGRAVFVRLPCVYTFPGGTLLVPAAASPNASVVHGPRLDLDSALVAARSFAEASAPVIGAMLAEYVDALARGDDPASVFG
jgi:hypothetical protein